MRPSQSPFLLAISGPVSYDLLMFFVWRPIYLRTFRGKDDPPMRSLSFSLRRGLAVASLLALLAPTLACSLYRNDKAWIPEQKYAQAKRVYNETNSLEQTKTVLRDSHNWTRPEINEAEYRLKKEFRLE
jgi:hypothetical protein